MTGKKNTDIMIPQENRQKADEIMDFMKTLEQHEEREFLAFLQGAKFMNSLTDAAESA